ncbi:hypothetical protein GCM10025778_36740 [Paeniglutamicibacter antarcticus]|uniref:Uncharacterized protein n=1 Tax=Paeniglutamicibacter antarcticus TaxID=494023 RepID=A0ABP9TW75_9MICC
MIATPHAAKVPIPAYAAALGRESIGMGRTDSPAKPMPEMTIPKMDESSYWLNGNSVRGICSGSAWTPHKFCNGRRIPVTNQGSNPNTSAPTPMNM